MKTGTATIPGLVFFLLVSILSCEPNENRGHGYIPDELYNFLDSISDTIKLYNSKNDCIELVNYKKQLVTQNIIYDADSYDRESGGLFVDEFYYEYDSYYTYFKSDSMHLRIAIKSSPNHYYYRDFFRYIFAFEHHRDSIMEFDLWLMEYGSDEIATLTGSGPSILSVRLSEGILSLTTKSGQTYQHVPHE